MPTNATRFYDSSQLVSSINFSTLKPEKRKAYHVMKYDQSTTSNKSNNHPMTTMMNDDNDVPDNEPVAPRRNPHFS